MKVLLFNGSNHINGCTFTALSIVADELQANDVDSEIFQCGAAPVRDCTACGKCYGGSGKCVFDDDLVNEFIAAAHTADGFVFGTPVYYAHASGRIMSVLDRAFYAGKAAFVHKPGAVIASARRAGTTCALDDLQKYLTINQMPVAASTYWNMVHGSKAEDVLRDEEGVQTMKNLALNLAWLLKCIKAGGDNGIAPPKPYTGARTNFIR